MNISLKLMVAAMPFLVDDCPGDPDPPTDPLPPEVIEGGKDIARDQLPDDTTKDKFDEDLEIVEYGNPKGNEGGYYDDGKVFVNSDVICNVMPSPAFSDESKACLLGMILLHEWYHAPTSMTCLDGGGGCRAAIHRIAPI